MKRLFWTCLLLSGLLLSGATLAGQDCNNIGITALLINNAQVELNEVGGENVPEIETCSNTLSIYLDNNVWPNDVTFKLLNEGDEEIPLMVVTPDPPNDRELTSDSISEHGLYRLEVAWPSYDSLNPICTKSYFFRLSAPTLSIPGNNYTITCNSTITLSLENAGGLLGVDIAWYEFEDSTNPVQGPTTGLASINVSSAGQYYAQANCLSDVISSNSVTVSENSDLPNAEISSDNPDLTITCNDPSITLSAAGLGENDMVSVWTATNGGILEGDPTDQQIEATTQGTYTLKVTNNVGCLAMASVVVEDDRGMVKFSIDNIREAYCQGSEVTLTASPLNSTEDHEYTWDLEGELSSGPAFTVNTSETGTYNLNLTAQNQENGCEDNKSYTISVVPSPNFDSLLAAIDLPNLLEGYINTTIDLLPGTNSESWSILRGESENVLIPATGFPASGSGSLRIIFGNLMLADTLAPGQLVYELVTPEGCSTRIAINIFPDVADDLFIPELISPNGDGINDEWNIGFPPAAEPTDFRIQVFDRYGQLVFETDDIYQRFSALNCANGQYFYQIEDLRPERGKVYRGALTVIGKE